jgi:hypothetical protein
MTLSNTEPTRKQRFNAALQLAGLTWERWTTEYYQVSTQHLNEVLNGNREPSAEFNAALDGFINRYLGSPNAA